LDSQIQWCIENDCYECFSSKYSMWRDWRAERSLSLSKSEISERLNDFVNSNMYGCGNVLADGVSMRRLSGTVPFEEK